MPVKHRDIEDGFVGLVILAAAVFVGGLLGELLLRIL